MSTLDDLWKSLQRDTKLNGECTEAALVLADALLERGDVRGELISVAVAQGMKAQCWTDGDIENQRLMRASHPPADMVRTRSFRWTKRRRHVNCPLAPKPVIVTATVVCTCPQREPVLYRSFRQMSSGAWTWENVFSAAEPEHHVELRVEWTWREEAELLDVEYLAQLVQAMVIGPGVENKDTDHFVRVEIRRFFEDWKKLPPRQYLARRLASYLGLHDLERRLATKSDDIERATLDALTALRSQPR